MSKTSVGVGEAAVQFRDGLRSVTAYVEQRLTSTGETEIPPAESFMALFFTMGEHVLSQDMTVDLVAAKAAYLHAALGNVPDLDETHIDEHLGEGVGAIFHAIPEIDFGEDFGQYVLRLSALDRPALWAAACCNLAALKTILQQMSEQGALAVLTELGTDLGHFLGFLGSYGVLQSHLWDNTICEATDEVSQQIRALVLP